MSSKDTPANMSGKLVEPIFFFGKRGCDKSISMEMVALEFMRERENLEQLCNRTTCETHRQSWGKELIIPLWTSRTDETLFYSADISSKEST